MRMDAEERRLGSVRLNCHERRPGWRPFLRTEKIGQLLDSRRLEESSQRKIFIGELFDLSKQAYGEERMSTEIEEVVFDPNGVNTQDLFPNPRHPRFHLVARRHKNFFQVGPAPVRHPKRLAVHLAVGSEG